MGLRISSVTGLAKTENSDEREGGIVSIKLEIAKSGAPHDHRWTDDELKQLIAMWLKGEELSDIAHVLGVTTFAIRRQVQKLRANGVPIPRRKNGHRAGRHNQLWTQEEVEFLVRRRNEKATVEVIGIELGRSFLAVQGMIQQLRREGVSVRMLGHGVRKLWSPDRLREAIVGRQLRVVGEDE